MKRENRLDRTTDRQSFGNGRMTLNVAALRRTAAMSSSGRHCCPGLRCVFGCAFGCAFRCFFPLLRASRAAGVLFGTGRTSFLLESFRSKSSAASMADWCSTPHAPIQQLAEFVVLRISWMQRVCLRRSQGVGSLSPPTLEFSRGCIIVRYYMLHSFFTWSTIFHQNRRIIWV